MWAFSLDCVFRVLIGWTGKLLSLSILLYYNALEAIIKVTITFKLEAENVSLPKKLEANLIRIYDISRERARYCFSI